MRRGIVKLAVAIAAYILAFGMVRFAMKANREHRNAARAKEVISKLQIDAAARSPNAPLSVATRDEAIEQASRDLDGITYDQKRANKAADMFWGFYYVNARARPAFCREQGADIQPFVRSFEGHHVKEVAQVRAIYSRIARDENTVYAGMEEQGRRIILQDMTDFAAANKVSLKEACAMIAANADEMVSVLLLSKVQPDVYRALFSVR